MANIHRLNRNQNQGFQPVPRDQQPGLPGFVASNKIPFLYQPSNDVAPLDESIPYTLKITFCPTLKPLSFVTIVILILIGLYTAMCIVGLDDSPKTSGILVIKSNTLINFGANQVYKVHAGQVYRLITYAFLNENLSMLLLNILCLCILGSQLESCLGTWRVTTLSLIAAVCGGILSDEVNADKNAITVGTSPLTFGLLGALLGYLIANWSAFRALGHMRYQLTCMTTIFLVLGAMLTVSLSQSSRVDNFLHLGAFVGGLFCVMAIGKPVNPQINWPKWVGLIVLGAFLVGQFVPFYLQKY